MPTSSSHSHTIESDLQLQTPTAASIHSATQRPRLRLPHSGGEWTSNVVHADSSQNKTSSMTSHDSYNNNPSILHRPAAFHSELSQNSSQPLVRSPKQPKSPCFVHSLLDRGVSFQEWLQQTRTASIGVAKSLPIPENTTRMLDDLEGKRNSFGSSFDKPPVDLESVDEEDSGEETDDFEGTSSLTRQLAETAVGVREMSKQLGKSHLLLRPGPSVLTVRMFFQDGHESKRTFRV